MAQHFLLSAKCRDFGRPQLQALTDHQVVEMFAEARWGSKGEQICPDCGTIRNHYWRRHRNQWRCRDCGRDFSVTSGTVFEDRKIKLRWILEALFRFCVSASGVSACELSRDIVMTPRAAWLFVCKIREALIRTQETDMLRGVVHLDGGHFCGKRRDVNYHGRGMNALKRQAIVQKIEGPITGRQRRKKQFVPGGKANAIRRRNRRIILVARELHPAPGMGAC